MRLIDADRLERLIETQKEINMGTYTGEVAQFAMSTVYGLVFDAIHNADTVEPVCNTEMKYGRWEKREDHGWKFWRCSACETGFQLTKYDYCPFCGAYMDGGYDG